MKGTVIRRGKSWSVVLDLGRDASGKRLRKWHSGFKTKKEAERERVELLHKVHEGSYVSPSNLTLDVFLREQWLPAIRASVRPATLSSYRGLIEQHIAPALGTTSLQRLAPATINGFYADLLDHGRSDGSGGLSPKTVPHSRGLEEGIG